MIHESVLRHTEAAPAGAQPVNFAGKWHNELTSTVNFIVQGSSLTGTYESAVSGGPASIKGDLVGFINGDMIAFTVSWPTAAITAWVGQLTDENGVETIKTLWQMTQNVADANEPKGLWASINAGADSFIR